MRLQSVVIGGKGYKLSGTFIVPDKISQKLPAVVFYHGMISQSKPRYIKRAQALAKVGICGLAFDFRSCGESKWDCKLSLSDWFKDSLLAFDFLSEQKVVDPKRIGIAGKSFGGYMGSLVCGRRMVKSMVLQAPGSYPDSWFKLPYQPSDWLDDEFAKQRAIYRKSKNALSNQALRAIRNYKRPLLVVGGEIDDVCPKELVEGYFKLCQAKQKEIIWIKGADHPLTREVWNRQYTQIMTSWFKQTL